MNYYDLIPSKSYKKYLKDNSIELDETLVASLILRYSDTVEGKIRLLKGLLSEIKDTKFKNIVSDHISYLEINMKYLFSKKSIFIIESVDKDDNSNCIEGIYDTMNACLSFISKDYYKDCYSRYNIYMYDMNTNCHVALIHVDLKGQITYYYIDNPIHKPEIDLDMYLDSIDREFPFKFTYKTISIIKNRDNDDYGIVYISANKETLIRHKIPIRPEMYVEFFDIDSGEFYHEHMFPSDFEVVKNLDDLPEDLKFLFMAIVDIKEGDPRSTIGNMLLHLKRAYIINKK